MLLLSLIFACAAFSEEFTARVVRVHDADTIVVLRAGVAETVRLRNIDCPETQQASGARAQKYASQLLHGKNLRLKTYGKDQWNRTIAEIFLENGKLINQELVLRGYCKWGRSRALRR